jgi:hypothetical protein
MQFDTKMPQIQCDYPRLTARLYEHLRHGLALKVMRRDLLVVNHKQPFASTYE